MRREIEIKRDKKEVERCRENRKKIIQVRVNVV
jgi:hypothetical protein